MKVRRSTFDRLIAWSPVLLLGSFAALTYWLNAQVQSAGPPFDGTGRHDPDVLIEDVQGQVLDAEGRVRQALTARVARHYPDDDTTEFDSPHVVFSEPGKPNLSITAEHAMVTGDRQHAYFSGNVRGVQEAKPGDSDGPVILTSEYLHVIPKEDRVLTDRAVTIEDARGIIHATGMEYDNRSKKVKFGSHVSGRLQPHQQ